MTEPQPDAKPAPAITSAYTSSTNLNTLPNACTARPHLCYTEAKQALFTIVLTYYRIYNTRWRGPCPPPARQPGKCPAGEEQGRCFPPLVPYQFGRSTP